MELASLFALFQSSIVGGLFVQALSWGWPNFTPEEMTWQERADQAAQKAESEAIWKGWRIFLGSM